MAGCVDYLGPDVGPSLATPCDNDDSDPSRRVNYQLDIQGPIFNGPCQRCHDPSSDRPSGITRVALDLTSYDAIRRGGVNSRQSIVVPGRPCNSVLVRKVMEGPPFGVRMPINGPYLADDVVTKLHDWIAEGARE